MLGAFTYALLYFLFGRSGHLDCYPSHDFSRSFADNRISYIQFLQTLRNRYGEWGQRWKKAIIAWLIKQSKKEQIQRGKRRSLRKTPQIKDTQDSEIPIIHDFAEKSHENERKPREDKETAYTFCRLLNPNPSTKDKSMKSSWMRRIIKRRSIQSGISLTSIFIIGQDFRGIKEHGT